MTEETKKEMKDFIKNDSWALSSTAPGSDEESAILKNILTAQTILTEDSKIENLKICNDLKIQELKIETDKLDIEKMKISAMNKQTELEIEKMKKQSRKEVAVAIVGGVVKLAGIAACVVTAGAFVGASMQCEYEAQMVKPRSLGDGLKFITSIVSKMI